MIGFKLLSQKLIPTSISDLDYSIAQVRVCKKKKNPAQISRTPKKKGMNYQVFILLCLLPSISGENPVIARQYFPDRAKPGFLKRILE